MLDVSRVNVMMISNINKGLTLSEAKTDKSFTEKKTILLNNFGLDVCPSLKLKVEPTKSAKK